MVFILKLIYSKNQEIWNILVKKTIEIDDFNSQSRYNNYNIICNQFFAEKLETFSSLKRFRKKRSKIHRLEKSKVIINNNNQ